MDHLVPNIKETYFVSAIDYIAKKDKTFFDEDKGLWFSIFKNKKYEIVTRRIGTIENPNFYLIILEKGAKHTNQIGVFAQKEIQINRYFSKL